MSSLVEFDHLVFKEGFSKIAGVDEAGRGPLAGPVVAAACIIPCGVVIEGINDSKKLTPLKREKLFDEITQHPEISFGIGVVSSSVIDEINILQATILAMQQAVSLSQLGALPDLLLVDGLYLPGVQMDVKKVIKGDARSQLIAAASILAKVTRDRLMEEAASRWPQYGFKSHKGYGTKSHLKALSQFGPCPIHRLSFAPLSKVH